MKKQKTSLKLHLFSGFHDSNLSDQFQSSLLGSCAELTIPFSLSFEIKCYPIASARCLDLAHDNIHLFIGFSAGVIRAAIAAHRAQLNGRTVAGLIAIDGWGVPLCDRSFAIYRFSHDPFTHLTSSLIGAPGVFFADPPVEHLSLWGQPHQVKGWYSLDSNDWAEVTAREALIQIIQSLVARSTQLVIP